MSSSPTLERDDVRSPTLASAWPDVEQRLRVDWILCDGYGLCSDLLPDLIDLDDWRYPIIGPEPIDKPSLHAAQRAVDCCPMKALILEPVRAKANLSPGTRRRSPGPGPAAHHRRPGDGSG